MVVLCYLQTTFGKRAIEIPDGSRRDLNTSLENVGKYSFIEPESKIFVYEGETIHYWTKPLNKALNMSMTTQLFNRKERVKETIKLDNVDLVFGEDHGEQRF